MTAPRSPYNPNRLPTAKPHSRHRPTICDQHCAETGVRKREQQHHSNTGTERKVKLPRQLQRAMDLGSEKGASSWLSALPIEDHGFTLHFVMPYACGTTGSQLQPISPANGSAVKHFLLAILSAAPQEAYPWHCQAQQTEKFHRQDHDRGLP